MCTSHLGMMIKCSLLFLQTILHVLGHIHAAAGVPGLRRHLRFRRLLAVVREEGWRGESCDEGVQSKIGQTACIQTEENVIKFVNPP